VDGGIGLAGFVQLDRRNHQPLVKAFGGVGGQSAGRNAAQVRYDHHRAVVKQRRSLAKDRAEHADIGGVDPAAEMIVANNCVAVLERFGRVVLEHLGQHAVQRRHMHSAAARMRNQARIAIEQRDRDLGRLIDEGRIGAAGAEDSGFLRDSHQRVLHDFTQKRVPHHRPPCRPAPES
jgi:hypothetical protein